MASTQELLLGEGAGGAAPNYIEDVFSTYLYAGTGATNTITNNIDLSTKGGMVWNKSRSTADANGVWDTARGVNAGYLQTEDTGAQSGSASQLTSFNTTGFTLPSTGYWNTSGQKLVSWTFRKQPKFFDVVTYTGTGANRTISHSLGSVPGCIIVRRTDAAGGWQVYHRSLANTQYMVLNTTAAVATGATRWNSTTPTSTVFSVGTDATVNANGGTYVAYLFAHDAGGFGLTGTDNVISCGSFSTTSGSTTTVNLGYEPQWILFKPSNGVSDWWLYDSTRGWVAPTGVGTNRELLPNTANAEGSASSSSINVTSSGFVADGTYFGTKNSIYITIRRGPMKVPTDATKVFGMNLSAATTGTALTTNFPVDFQLGSILKYIPYVWDRLRGADTYGTTTYSTPTLRTSTTGAEGSNNYTLSWNNTGFAVPSGLSGTNTLYYSFRRAPSFFDEVCYRGTGVARTIAHNLGVAPEMIIIKGRDYAGGDWPVYLAPKGNAWSSYLNLTYQGDAGVTLWNSTTPTSSVFSLSGDNAVNGSAYSWVAYLFATCPGISKVGSYTGTGTLTTIDCGFTGGARFVMIKRTNASANWYVWDTTRGMVAGTDPSFNLNTSTGETNANSVYTITTGFQLLASPSADVNTNGGTYIYLAIA